MWANKPRFVRAKIKDQWDALIQELVAAQGLPSGAPWSGAVLVYTLHFCHKRRRDIENYLVVPKFITDGLVRAGVLQDDNWQIAYPLVFFAGENSPEDYVDLTIYPHPHPHEYLSQYILEGLINPHG